MDSCVCYLGRKFVPDLNAKVATMGDGLPGLRGPVSKREPLVGLSAQRDRFTRDCTQQGHGQQCGRRCRTYRPRFHTNLKGFSLNLSVGNCPTRVNKSAI
jgi:hypothetical protein